MITRWLNRDTGSASGVPPAVPILVVEVDYASIRAGWETVVYVTCETQAPASPAES